MFKFKWILLILVAVFLAGFWYLWKREVIFPPQPIETLTPQSEIDYNRRLRGSFEELNEAGGQIKITGRDRKTYVFSVPRALIDKRDIDLMVQAGTQVEVSWRDERAMKQILTEYEQEPQKPLNAEARSIRIKRLE